GYETAAERPRNGYEIATRPRRGPDGGYGPDSGRDDTGCPESEAAARSPRHPVFRRVTERARRVWPAVAWLVALDLLFPSPLWAIPSPDLVVNFFASAAQVLGLLTITLGGVAYSVSRRPGATAGPMGRWWRWGLGVSLGLLAVSLAANVLQYTNYLDK